MIKAALTVSSVEFWVLVALAAVVGAYLWHLEKKIRATKADRLTQTYRELTAETLASLSDEELLPAVVANLMAKQDEKQPDPYFALSQLSPSRAAVYRVWLVCRETENGGFAALFRPKTRLIAEAAAEDLITVGAVQCGEALAAAFEAVPMGGSPAEGAEETFVAACESEGPLSLCVAYIRENPEEFAD